jgi:hypothetical protein
MALHLLARLLCCRQHHIFAVQVVLKDESCVFIAMCLREELPMAADEIEPPVDVKF